jgi:hypothetical protein
MRVLIARYRAHKGRGGEMAWLLEEMAAAVAADEPACLESREREVGVPVARPAAG